MKNLWNTISLIGSKKLKSPEDLRELSLLNRIIFIAVINLTSFIPIIIYFQQYPSVIAISIGILLCLLVLYMNHIGYFGFARTAFLFIAVLFVSGILVFMSGAHAGSQVVFVMLTTLHLVLFRRPKYIFMVFLLIMAVLGIVSYWAENHTALLDNADPFIRVFSFYMNVVSCSVLVFAIVLYFRNTTYEHEKTIVEQNQKILEKNKDITDSINYARRLQNAILPPVNAFKHHFSDSFVLYLPKDIVAGDFYWLEEVENDNGKMVFVAAADCTGHGVPGAIVSVVCNNALNRSLREFKLHEPGELLDRTRQLVISEFEKSDDEVKALLDNLARLHHSN
ncbi:MAG TPA: hypothetical protein VK177_15735, partial [Flavobacteriales bacterium]|nr:hypothetical protein [Flavobacteriales bacterium]